MFGCSIGKLQVCVVVPGMLMILGCKSGADDEIDSNTAVKDLTAFQSESLCEDIAQGLTDAEVSTKERHCIAEVWGMSDSPEACRQAAADCVATPDEELDNLEEERKSVYDDWFGECTSGFVTDAATYKVKDLEACTDALAEARACIFNNDKLTCDTVSPEAANELSVECAALDDQADALCAMLD